jgi:NAD(P)-dependent dehydrogenase (short-subunit alcohol dehydrogenase family)
MGELRYDGKVAVVTGAGRGLGAAYARLLASRGAAVLVNDAGVVLGSQDDRPDPAAEVVAEIRAVGGRAVADGHDVVTDGAAVVDHALAQLGRLDIVICNAGFAGGGQFVDIADDDFDRVCDVHIKGTRSVVKAAWPHLVAAGAGRIVTTSSASVFGSGGTSPYITGKSAVFGFTRALSHEAKAVGITVNSIMPSAYTRLTAQVPDETFRAFLSEHFAPERIAPFVAWLVHESTTINGECFSVGAGRAARVFLGETAGVHLPDGGSPEDWAERKDDLFALDGWGAPADMLGEVTFQVENLGGLGLGSEPVTSMSSDDWAGARAGSRPG